MQPEKLLQCIECDGNSFSLRYFCILIPFVHSLKFFLKLEVLRRQVKVLGYLLNQHSSYPSSITFSDCNLLPFPSRGHPIQYLSDCFLLLGYIYFIKQNLRPSTQIQYLVPTHTHTHTYIYIYIYICVGLNPPILIKSYGKR